jgi:iron complex outermembrane receptor protein
MTFTIMHLKLKRNIKVFPIILLGLLMMVSAMAQSGSPITVRGTVVDTSGETVIGANILLQGTTTGTITDIDGNFTIQAPANGTLVVSFIGYHSQIIPINNQNQFNITLVEDTEMLDELIVIGYGTVRRSDATGAITTIRPDEINRGVITNPQDMITGRVAGVNIISDGMPGAGATIRIRGGSSLSASNDPLIVIDGLPMDNEGIKGMANALSLLNPNDIETFTVLKDASATAIYGSRASNGVIIITTRRGTAGSRPRVQYDGNMSLGMRRNSVDVMTGDQFRDYATRLYTGVSEDALRALGTANTNWQREIFRVAAGTDHNISVMGGLKNMPYRASVGYTSQQGILRTSKFERITASATVNPSLFDDHLRINLNARGMVSNNRFAETGAIGAAIAMDPTQSVMSNAPIHRDNFGGFFQWANLAPDGSAAFNRLASQNPVAQLKLRDERATAHNFLGNAEFDYRFHFLPELRTRLGLGIDVSDGIQYLNVDTRNPQENPYGRIGEDHIYKTNQSLNWTLQYANVFANRHSLDVMAGYEWQHFYREGSEWQRGIVPLANGNPHNPTSSAFKTESYLVSFFGRINYVYDNRYLFTATLRNDGTSRFSPENRWGLFPSFAAAWRISEEAFMFKQGLFSDLRLRLGYGITGQQNIGMGDYPWIPVYSENRDGAYYIFGDEWQTTFRPDAFNPGLKWEETTTYNAGLDFGFANQRFTGSADVYHRVTNDLINVIDIPVGTNFRNRVVSNIGSMTNTGLEFSLNGDVVRTGNWNWNVGYNVTFNRNEITQLTASDRENFVVETGVVSASTDTHIQAHAVGFPMRSFYVFQQVYDSNGRPIENLFVDRNGDGIINEDDRYFFKSPVADVLMGFASTLSYKNFDLGFTLRASIGNYVYNDVAARNADVGIAGIWAPSGFFSNRPMSAFETNFQGIGNFARSDYFIQNASFLRMDNITLGWNFTHLAAERLSNARLFLSVQNPFVWTKYTGLDPEVRDGIDNDIFPRPVTTLMGVSLSF